MPFYDDREYILSVIHDNYLNINKVAIAIGVTRQSLHNYLTRVSIRPNPDLMLMLCRHLGIEKLFWDESQKR